MPWIFTEFFNIDIGVAERSLGFSSSHGIQIRQRSRRVHDLHALASTTCRRLDNNRETDLGSNTLGLFSCRYIILGARQNRHAIFDDRLTSSNFVAHQTNILWRRADKCQTTILTDFSKFSVLCKEAIAWMNSFSVGYFGGADNCLHIEIAFTTRSPADTDAFIGDFGMQGVDVCIRVHCNRQNPHLFAGTDNAQRNFATICDQNFTKHGCLLCA